MTLPGFMAEASLDRRDRYYRTENFISKGDGNFIQPQLSVIPIACLKDCRAQYVSCIRVLGSRFECQSENRACMSSCIRGSRF